MCGIGQFLYICSLHDISIPGRYYGCCWVLVAYMTCPFGWTCDICPLYSIGDIPINFIFGKYG